MKNSIINNEIIQSFLSCNYKAFLKHSGKLGYKTEYELLEHRFFKMYKEHFLNKLYAKSNEIQILEGFEPKNEIQCRKLTYVVDPIYHSKDFIISVDALEIIPVHNSSKNLLYIPIAISPKEKIYKNDKLLLTIKTLLIGSFCDITPEYGKIIYGRNSRSTKCVLNTYFHEASKLLKKLKKIVNDEYSPDFFKNDHCQICEFQERCRAILMDKDDLSLLGRMGQKEIIKQNNRGIFTIHQLSYTFRPKKKRKQIPSEPQRLEYALKALALREKKTYVIEVPKLTSSKVEIYLDIEGLLDENFNYLIGIVIRENGMKRQFSFWADSAEDEEKIFISLFNILSNFKDFTIYHYGSYEIQSLKRINKRFKNRYEEEINKIIKNSFNILSLFSTHIYPPTYSNKLTDIANFLGFKWSEKNASGIQSIVWRKRWELSQDSKYKDKLIKYNIEDCLALDLIKDWLESIEQKFEKEKNESFGNVRSKRRKLL